jgi:uncharacterized membrane protein YfcA
MMPEVVSFLVLGCTGALAAALNAVAGGGTLLTFPVLMAFGASALHANATCSAALWLGGLASAFGYSAQFGKTRRYLRTLLWPSVLGSALGAWLLSRTSESVFKLVVPALVLVATALLAAQPYLRPKEPSRRIPPWLGMVLQFLICTYGGYFGAGMGILMLAMMGLFMEGDLHQFNALKAWLAVLVNVIATLMFLYQGLVQIKPMVALSVGALLGGYLAARGVQKVDPSRLRAGVVTLGLALSAWCAWQACH